VTVDQIWAFLKQQWPGVVALLGVGQLWRTRREQVLKSRLQLGVEMYDVFSALTDAVLIWTSPFGLAGEEDKDVAFARKMGELHPKAVLMMHRAELILSPDLATELGEILDMLQRIHIQRFLHDSLAKSEEANSQRYAAFKVGREHLPQKMEAATRRLMYLLHKVTVGRLRAWWWWRRRDAVKKDRLERKQVHIAEENAIAKVHEKALRG